MVRWYKIIERLTTDKYGDTALMRAAHAGGIHLIKMMLACGADVNAKTNSGETALMAACQYLDNGTKQTDCIKLLLANGADVNAKSMNGNTALMQIAHKEGNFDIAKLLIASGADVNTKNEYGETALILTAYAAISNIAKLLIDNGADVNAKNIYGETALIRAAKARRDSFIKMMIECGADVNAKTNTGETALITACQDGFHPCCRDLELLLANGADVNAKTDYGWTALMWATYNKNSFNNSTIQLLENAGAKVQGHEWLIIQEYERLKLKEKLNRDYQGMLACS